MSSRPRRLPRRALGLLGLAALALILLSGHALVRLAIAGRLRRAAADRGLVASWGRLDLEPPIRVRILDLTMARPAGGDTVFHADSIAVAIDPTALLAFAIRPERVELAHARFAPSGAGGEATGGPAAESAAPDHAPRGARAAAERVRRTAETVTRMMLAPARQLPELRLRDVEIEGPPADDGTPAAAPLLAIQRLDLIHRRYGIGLSGSGTVGFEQVVPFDLALDYAHDDWLAGRMWFGVPDSVRGGVDTLLVRIEGTLVQDRRRGELTLSDPTRVWIGALPLTLGGTLAQSGPAASLHLAAKGVTASLIERSIPAPLLGPLIQIAVEGSFDYRLDLAVDVARPDSVELAVRVIPHDLAINADGTTLPILGLDQPFTATIHLPRGRTAVRDLSSQNPFFRPLESIDTTLVYAVVANEDGGFFRHHGFNLEAVRGSITEDLRAGAYRRGAGTITMQLARNLYLGHQRTLSRKAQEVGAGLDARAPDRALEAAPARDLPQRDRVGTGDPRRRRGREVLLRSRRVELEPRPGAVPRHAASRAHQVALQVRQGRRAAPLDQGPDALHRARDGGEGLARSRAAAARRSARRRDHRPGAG